MLRLPLVLALVFILRTFGSTSKQSTEKVFTNQTQQNQCRKYSLKECCSCRDGRDGRDGQNGKDGRDGRDGRNGAKGEKGEHGSFPGNSEINAAKGVKGDQGLRGNDGIHGTKGQKGEPGSSAKIPDGVIKFTDTADNCTLRTAGTVRYSNFQNSLQLCDGSAWWSLVTTGKHGRHCLDILKSGQSRGSGIYWIDPTGGSTDDSFQAFCDMETERGGWTLVATKVSPSFLFIKTAFSTLAAKTKYADAASHIHPDMRDWEEVMFRFSDVDTIRVIYSRKAGAPRKDKRAFDGFLMGKFVQSAMNVYGFYKYSPADNNKRAPAEGFATISSLYFYTDRGISEDRNVGSDKWIDMFNDGDRHNNKYITFDDSKALGNKCIAGYCYLNKPIWVMVR